MFQNQSVKIIAKNHQFLGVNNLMESVNNRKELGGKLGVFWHTQGSGKSYSMVFFARKVKRKIEGNFSFLVITDREDLDDQIHKNFVRTEVIGPKDECQPKNGEQLRQFLQTNKEFIFTLIHPPHEVMNYENVSLAYANNEDEAKNIIDYARSKGYVFINYSKSNKNYSPYSQYEEDVDTHHVIGQEFDKIIMLLDNSFYYDENNQLKGVTHPNPDYLYEKLFYQGMTRVREKLALVVVKAPDLFEKITSIFEEKSEKKDGNIT